MKYIVGICVLLMVHTTSYSYNKDIIPINNEFESLPVVENKVLKNAVKSLKELEHHYGINLDKNHIEFKNQYLDHMAYYREIQRLINQFSPPFKLKTNDSFVVIEQSLPFLTLLEIKAKKIEKLLLSYQTIGKDGLSKHIKTKTL